MAFFSELRRRSVFRVGALYVIVSWLILQVTDVFTSFMPLPEWTGRLVFLLCVVGFPIALVLAWAFELTPEGLKRETVEPSPAPPTQRKSDRLIYALLLSVVAYLAWQHDWGGEAPAPQSATIRSMVVLPFEDLMNDPEQAYFVAGMHDALIAELSRIEALRVISRTSATRFRDSGKSIPEIARELDVEAVVEGSVLRAGDTVRIKVQLIEAATDRHLWTQDFDRELRDILALYSDVTEEIAHQVRLTLTPGEQALMDAAQPVDPQVYELYLEGRYLCDNWSPQEMAQGVRLLERATALDPRNAPAHAHLALCLQYSAFFGYTTPDEIHDASRAAAETAIRLDNELAAAHVALAGIQYYLEFDPASAMDTLERALELEPNSVRALLHASWLLGESGRFAEAYEHSEHALDLDPLSTVVIHARGQLHFLNRDYDKAVTDTERALAQDPGDPSMHYFLALPFEQQGRLPEALASHRKAVELSRGMPLYRAGLGHAQGLSGDHVQAQAILDELLADPQAARFDVALVYLGMGDHSQAIHWLERAYEQRDSQLIYINRDPRFDPLRSEPRFVRLLDRFGFPEGDGPVEPRD